MNISIERLTDDADATDYVESMARAFDDYPVMERAFPNPERRAELLRLMIAGGLAERRRRGEPTFVARVEGQIVGGAFCFEDDGDGSGTPKWWTDFIEVAGIETEQFFDGFFERILSIPVPKPHTWLAMIGVHPDFQGKGVGRRLLDHVQQYSRDRGDLGVVLDTEHATNVELYQVCGFTVAGQTSYDDMPIWVMFRPNDRP